MKTTIRFSTDGEKSYALGTKLGKILRDSGIARQSGKTATYKGNPGEQKLSDAISKFWQHVSVYRKVHPKVRMDHFWMYVEAPKRRKSTRRRRRR